MMVQDLDESSLFRFEPVVQQSKSNERGPGIEYSNLIPKDSFLCIFHKQSKMCMSIHSVETESTAKKGIVGTEKAGLVPKLVPFTKDELVFKLFRANPNEIWESYFLISCNLLLKKFVGYLKSVNFKNFSF